MKCFVIQEAHRGFHAKLHFALGDNSGKFDKSLQGYSLHKKLFVGAGFTPAFLKSNVTNIVTFTKGRINEIYHYCFISHILNEFICQHDHCQTKRDR